MTKRDDMVTKLRAGWCSAPDLCAENGWLPHTLRAAISTSAKAQSLKIERRRVDGVTSYRFVEVDKA